MASDLERDGQPGGLMPAGPGEVSVVQAEHSDDAPRPIEANHADPVAAALVHDLNNLLTVVLGSLEQLRRQPLDGRGQQQLERAQWATWRAGQLAQEVLTAAVAAADGKWVRVDVNEAVGAFGRLMGGQVAENGCGLVLEPAPGPLPVRLDPGQLERALLNLVRNAADAMPPGGEIVIRTAAVAAEQRLGSCGAGRPAAVAVSVSDTGTGMPSEVVARGGEAFFTTKGRGTGLGLWAVRRFVQAAGGTVEIETAMGQGTTVRLVLPRAEEA